MSDAFRVIGALTGAATAFAAVFALGYEVTNGSVWMLAFFPPLFAAPASVAFLLLRPLSRDL